MMRVPSHKKTCRLDHSKGIIPDILKHTGNSATVEVLNALAPVSEILELCQGLAYPERDFSLLLSNSDAVKATAAAVVGCMTIMPDGLPWPGSSQYSREDCRQIRYIIEVYCSIAPIVAVTAATAMRWLGKPEAQHVYRHAECLQDTQHRFFSSLLNWPVYLKSTVDYVESAGDSVEFADAWEQVKAAAEHASRSVPFADNNIRCSSPELISEVHKYFDQSCSLVVLVSALKRVLVREESDQRSRKRALVD